MIRAFFTRNGTSVDRKNRRAMHNIAPVCVGVAAMSALVAHAQLRLPEVRVEDMNGGYWQRRFSGARRVLSAQDDDRSAAGE